MLATLCATALHAPAMAQGTPSTDAGRPTSAMIGKSCAVDHARFCPLTRAGTSVDVACMQQHHIDLSITCRNLLARARPPGADGAPAAGAADGGVAGAGSGGGLGTRPRAAVTP